MAKASADQLKLLAAFAKTKPSKHGAHAGHGSGSVRSFKLGKKRVDVTTTYKVKVDGKPFKIDLEVAPDGTVICHALPFYRASSALDVVAAAIMHIAGLKKPVKKAALAKATKKPKVPESGSGHRHDGGL